MFEKIRKWNRKNIKNYVEIYIANQNYKNLKNKKKFKKNIVGIDIKAELPTRPDIKVFNNFNKKVRYISNKLVEDIRKII
jgi:adenylylsulfate kinase-like enzyme